MTLAIRAAGIRHAYGPTPVLQGVDVEVAAGEVVAIMGPSGSGKSTLLHILAGLQRPDAGDVYLAGLRLKDMSEGRRSQLRLRDLGLVFQFGDLVPELTAVENVELPLQLLGVTNTEARRRGIAALERLGLADLASARLSEISGGEAQRVAVARALIHEPRVLLADEPTGSLDSRNGEVVIDSLLDAARDVGAAVVVVTHELRIAARADREILLRDGRVVADVDDPVLR